MGQAGEGMSDTVSAFIKAFSYLLAGEGVWGGLGKGTPFSALIEAISKDSTGVEAVCVWASALMRPVIIGTAAASTHRLPFGSPRPTTEGNQQTRRSQ